MKRLLSTAMLLLGFIGLAVVTTVPASAAAIAGNNECSSSIQNPHYSSGAGGIIVKGQWSCNLVPTTIHLDNFQSVEDGLWLYLCSSQPKKDVEWLIINCGIYGANHLNVTVSKAGTTYIRYAPPDSQPGAHGSGWWIAAAEWQSQGPGGIGNRIDTFSNAVELSG